MKRGALDGRGKSRGGRRGGPSEAAFTVLTASRRLASQNDDRSPVGASTWVPGGVMTIVKLIQRGKECDVESEGNRGSERETTLSAASKAGMFLTAGRLVVEWSQRGQM